MDLWIRSQNRKQITKFESLICEQNGDRFAVEVLTTGYSFLVGTYKTEKRALEVLDEIQNFIENNYESNIPSCSNNIVANGNIVLKTRRVVYEMPKE